MRCADVSPTQNDYQQYNTQREKQVLGKWFNIGDRSKKTASHDNIRYKNKFDCFNYTVMFTMRTEESEKTLI